jgi:hypothetical protein
MHTTHPHNLTLGQAARLIGCPEWWLRRQYQIGRLPEPCRVGILRVLGSADVQRAQALFSERQPRRPAAVSS